MMDLLMRAGLTGWLQLGLAVAALVAWLAHRSAETSEARTARVTWLLWLVALGPVVGLLGRQYGQVMALAAAAHASSETKSTLIAAGVSLGLSNLKLGLVALVPLGLAVISSWAQRGVEARRVHLPTVVGGLLAAAGVALGSVWGGGLSFEALPRVVLYAALALLCGGCAASPRDDLAIIGRVALPVAIGVGELAALGDGLTTGFRALAIASAETKAMMAWTTVEQLGVATAWARLAVFVAVVACFIPRPNAVGMPMPAVAAGVAVALAVWAPLTGAFRVLATQSGW